ncbi:MAG: YggS family pyridoxal phosphate-dependent enzyme [candidate division WOR-3 bacterium]|nr:YggS family pyridoxal phosphate-dependent enzyme [candidate division WOR-3 bacterium]
MLNNDLVAQQIQENIKNLQERITTTCLKVARSPNEIEIVAVTKTVPVEKIEIAINAGIKIIGENRVQEALSKFPLIGDKVSWHLIGHLQTNKVKKALEIFSVIQSVDSIHLAQEINKRASLIQKTVPILIEVNTSQEPTKFGVNPSILLKFVEQILQFNHLQLLGLMTIGPGLAVQDKEKSRPCFRLLYELKQKLQNEFKLSLPYLSMGMTSDFEVAIEEGANMIRIGTAIFGERPTN